MKILIWAGCFLGFAILRVLYMYSGILLGAIPRAMLAMGGFWLTWKIAKKLCDKWDQRKKGKEDEKPSSSNDNEVEDSIEQMDISLTKDLVTTDNKGDDL